MTAMDLLNTLEDLGGDEFKDFKWYLQQRHILEGYEAIKVSKLEKAKRRDTVNVMVNTYKPDGALKVTKKVLEKINRNDLVRSLPDTSFVSVDVRDVGESSENRGTSSSQSEDQKITKRKAEEQEISEQKKKRTEVCQLSHSEDHLQSLQNHYPSRTGQRSASVHHEGTVVRAVSQQVAKAELRRVQQYAVDVTLDPDTANPYLILSRDGKQVRHGDVKKNLPNIPKRFSTGICVLGKQSFSSGRFYFEVQVKGKTGWALGVSREWIDRKKSVTLSSEDGYLTFCLIKRNEYKALADPPVRLSLKSQPQKVGVFVDYEEGLVSFYDVDAAALICSFTGCSFTGKLFPFFNPGQNDGGKNSAPLIISPVRVKTVIYLMY